MVVLAFQAAKPLVGNVAIVTGAASGLGKAIPESEVTNWMMEQKQIIKKPLKPSDVAGVVCWLVSEETRMITGQAISIDGGEQFPTY
jgi:NAD(P)-dependent dehydrogenase (short-subunit alcohol dehydrogenase family)